MELNETSLMGILIVKFIIYNEEIPNIPAKIVEH